MSWIDGDVAPRWSENLRPSAKTLTPVEQDLYRKILNLEATISNLKQTILNMDKEMQVIRTKTGVSKYDSVESIIKGPVTKIFSEGVKSKLDDMEDKLQKFIEESSNTKSPFEIKVLDY